MVIVEIVLVFMITLGISGLRSLLSLVDSLLAEAALADQRVALNVSQATNQVLDFLGQAAQRDPAVRLGRARPLPAVAGRHQAAPGLASTERGLRR